ncbi:MAG: glycosyltransferase [Acidobacteria bacterium]|nr:glycosyltransferase [Acidobacteriota bacterium]
MTRPALVIPSLGTASLDSCLGAVASLEPGPEPTVVVLSGAAAGRRLPAWVTAVRSERRLGFAAAVNAGLASLSRPWPAVALLNDDAVPEPGWLGALEAAQLDDGRLAAVQGTVLDTLGRIDGRGITLDPFGLPVQVDRGRPAQPEPADPRPRLAVSGTACLLRGSALAEVELAGGGVLDPAVGSYHDDVDLGLRLSRLGWRASWVPGALCSHVGSQSGARFRWRHPWWVLANRWYALAANLTPAALFRVLPRLLRGELRAARALVRSNRRTVLVAPAVLATLPVLAARGWARRSAGRRLARLPGGRE